MTRTKRFSAKVGNYLYEDRVLLKRGKSMPWLGCVGQEEASRIIDEIHQSTCGIHKGATTLANKIFRQGYY